MGVKTNRSLALLVFVVLAATLSAFSLSIAFADDGFVMDDDDSPGPLDIERFGFFQEEGGGRLILELYEVFDPAVLDESLNWVGFVLEDDIADGEYERAVFVRNTGDQLVARLYRDGRTGSDAGTFIGDVGVQQTDPNTLEVFIPSRQYAPFHHWYAQTAFETIGSDDRGYPECNWATPPPRPFPPMAKCKDETMGITPTFESSPTLTDSGGPPTPPPCEGQSQCKRTYITIHYRSQSGIFRGRVRSGQSSRCLDHRLVLLQRSVAGGEMTTIGRDRTTAEGFWRVPRAAGFGRYQALVTRAERPAGGGSTFKCRRSISITIRP